MAATPIADLIGTTRDALTEEVLLIIYTDQPVRSSIRDDSRRHQQWFARDPRGNTSRLWLNYAEPFDDGTPGEIKSRLEQALAVLVPAHAKSVKVNARIVAVDEIDVQIDIRRPNGDDLPIGLTLYGGTHA